MHREPLSELRVVNQCPASWSQMTGTETVRHCSQCDRNVFNISELTHAEAVDLVKQTEGRVCVRYFQRRDGTILTRDCTVRDRVALRGRLALAAVCSVVGITMTTGCIGATADDYKDAPGATKSASKPLSEQHQNSPILAKQDPMEEQAATAGTSAKESPK